MIRRIFFLLILLSLITISCEDNEALPVIKPEATGVFTDERDGLQYDWVRFDGRDWMVQNLKAKTNIGNYKPYILEKPIDIIDLSAMERQNIERYGYLYDHEAATSAIPEGWRLPSDQDWQSLERTMGMAEKELSSKEWRGTVTGELLQQDNRGSGINLQTGGYYGYYGYIAGNTGPLKLTARWINAYGFFWTSTEDNENSVKDTAYYRKIQENSGQVYRNSTTKKLLLSVRCVRDAQ